MNSGNPASTGTCNLQKFMSNSNPYPKYPINIQRIKDKQNLNSKKVNHFPFAFDYWVSLPKKRKNLKNIQLYTSNSQKL